MVSSPVDLECHGLVLAACVVWSEELIDLQDICFESECGALLGEDSRMLTRCRVHDGARDEQYFLPLVVFGCLQRFPWFLRKPNFDFALTVDVAHFVPAHSRELYCIQVSCLYLLLIYSSIHARFTRCRFQFSSKSLIASAVFGFVCLAGPCRLSICYVVSCFGDL